MTKEDIEKLLPFYVANTLNEKEKKDVEIELSLYPELREELEFIKQLHQSTLIDVKSDEVNHPTSEEIVDFFEGDLKNNPILSRNIEKHIKDCKSCQREINILESLTQDSKLSLKKIYETLKEYLWPFNPVSSSSGDETSTFEPAASKGRMVIMRLNINKLAYITSVVGVLIIFSFILFAPSRENRFSHNFEFRKPIERTGIDTFAIPQLDIMDKTTHIDLKVPILYHPDANYNARILTPANDTVLYTRLQKISDFKKFIDTLTITLSLEKLKVREGKYYITVENITTLTTRLPSAEIYHYPFEVNLIREN